ncbi:MAG: hypothetical protein RDU41_09935 [Clostridia bacterium]|nr:hypothetical protein [Clostridia bacterium]
MTDREKGYRRDRAIIDLVTERRCVSADQIEALLFQGMLSGQRVCQRRLEKLTAREQLLRWRNALDQPYAYYLDAESRIDQMAHTVLLNWVYCWQLRRLKSWERIHSWSYEMDYGILRADAFAAIKNTVTGTFRFAFVELDRAESGNKFDKITKYNDLYESDNYADSWWLPLAKRFPPILMATTTTRQKAKIEKAVEAENRNGLEFQVYLVESLRQEVI